MKRAPRLPGLALAALMLAGPAAAQSPPRASLDPTAPAAVTLAPAQTSDDGLSTVLEELEVVARPAGPAMWRVRRGDAEVVIVGSYNPLPHSLAWNSARLQHLLEGADGFYEPKASLNPLELAGLLLTQGQLKLGGGRTLDGVIGPERQARLAHVVTLSHADPAKMQKFKPAAAGVLAYQTFIRTVGWSSEKPGTTIRRLARSQRVPLRSLTKLGVTPLIRSLERMDDAGQLACFDATLDQTEWESAKGRAAAEAWANGRVTELRRLRSTAILDRCLMENGGARAVLNKGIADSAASIDDLLKRPGRRVVLLDIEFLLPRDGVLDRLKAGGAEITLPPA